MKDFQIKNLLTIKVAELCGLKKIVYTAQSKIEVLADLN